MDFRDCKRCAARPANDVGARHAHAHLRHAKALKADTRKSQTDVLDLAVRLELGATNAYLGVIPSFKDAQLAKIAGRLAADEAMHYAVLLGALGRPLPNSSLPFGA